MVSIYDIPKLVKLAYMESFTSEFAKPGIWSFNEMTFSDEDFAPIDVYTLNHSENIAPNPETSSVTLEPQPFISLPSADMNEEDLLPENNRIESPETQPEPTINITITPKVIRSHPIVLRNRKTNKGRKPDSEESEESQISLQESSTSLLDFKTDEDYDTNIDVTPENIKDNCFILVKFLMKTSIVYYMEKVLRHYSPTELKVSYLCKNPGCWSFVFPDVEDIHTLCISDIAKILPDPQPWSHCTTRRSSLFTFEINLNNFNVQ
ncbi:hypothetical protein FQA39_LY08345 [Lamprigera yunnana]|nr:hypothetical protein FQA39_LY08345 [Lamprigera yunnana]